MVIYLITFLFAFAIISPVSGYRTINTHLDWKAANKACLRKYGTPLATIMDYEENKEVHNLCKGMKKGSCWIGAHDIHKEGNWVWQRIIGNKKICYSRWNAGEPNNSNREDCAELLSDGKWNDIKCNGKRVAICNEPKYAKLSCSLTWKQANARCKKLYGTTLATINSQEENAEAGQHCVGGGDCWIGGKYQSYPKNKKRPKEWVWENRQKGTVHMCYTNWRGGEPNNLGDEKCVEMWIKDSGWNDKHCDTLRNAICNARKTKRRGRAQAQGTPPGVITFDVDIYSLASVSAVLFLFSMMVVTVVCHRKRKLAKTKKYVTVDSSSNLANFAVDQGF